MMDSLQRQANGENYVVFVLALDNESYKILINRYIGSNIRVFPVSYEMLKAFNELESKFGRPNVFWGMGSQWMAHCLKTTNIDHVTYLDADLYFFSDPKVIFDEIGDKEVAITPHNFPSWDAQRLRGSGLYNVAWVYAKKSALSHIEEWSENVRARCDASTCGDQKYLDEWPGKLGEKLCVISNIGVDVAPWNVGRFCVTDDEVDGQLWVTDRENPDDMSQVVFYHFHEWQSKDKRTGYKLDEDWVKFIYEPYEKELKDVENLQNNH